MTKTNPDVYLYNYTVVLLHAIETLSKIHVNEFDMLQLSFVESSKMHFWRPVRQEKCRGHITE